MHGASREFLVRLRDDVDVPETWHDWAERALAR